MRSELGPSLIDRRFAAHQTVFRRANERLRTQADGSVGGPLPFVCECGDAACEAVVSMPVEEYEAVRAKSNQFLIVPGHRLLAGDAERVVASYDGYQVTAKFGPAARVAETTDPRVR